MDSLKTVTDLMSQGCYMASVDIKDAYYTVPIATEHQKFLKFRWRDKLYQYTCLPNGLASAPRILTKLLKPVFNIMRQKGYLSSSYIDDCYLQGATYGECHDNVQETLMLLGDLGFPIHNEKSVLIPSQVLTFLGFVLNSVTMTVQLTKSRKQKLKTACLTLVNKEPCTIQSVAEVIGVIVSSFPGVEHGPLHYRSLERDKSHALRENKGNFGSSMILSPSSRAELNWWISNVDTSLKLISHGEPELHIQTDASALGWGGLRGEQRTGGRWTQQEASHHINYLELLASYREMPGKNSSKQSRGDPGGALLDLPKLVSQIAETIDSSSIDDHSQGSPPDSSRVPETSPIEEKAESVSLSFVRRLYKNRGFSERATNIVLQSWRQSSQKQYDAHIRKWLLFCTKRQADPICPIISVAVDFLTSLYDEGLSYSSINSARCALSAILESPASAYPTFGEHPDVKRFMKGIFQRRHPLPRYCKTWDVNLVLQYIGSMGNSQELSLKDLTLKLVMLVALTTAQRGQSLQLLDTQNMVQEETAYTFMLNSNLKQSKPGKSTSDLVIKLNAYPYDRNLCVVNACSVYLARTKLLRGSESRLFITHQKPHKKASRDTIRRIDINVYKPHSVRSAATSKAKAANASVVEIMQTAGWSSAATFAKFYDREIEQGSSFADSVLSQS
ncbi:uncharacterized protein LOC141887255 [Acropora palmata]|uniref:uncharacterized protein LOC141887255 n=1 Tax=Acropora palmata TaxID=6131 RepID=UPI003DA1A6D9